MGRVDHASSEGCSPSIGTQLVPFLWEGYMGQFGQSDFRMFTFLSLCFEDCLLVEGYSIICSPTSDVSFVWGLHFVQIEWSICFFRINGYRLWRHSWFPVTKSQSRDHMTPTVTPATKSIQEMNIWAGLDWNWDYEHWPALNTQQTKPCVCPPSWMLLIEAVVPKNALSSFSHL